MSAWNDSVPIYRQLRDRLEAMIIGRSISEGAPLPSVRRIAAEERLNPLTVSRAFQMLVADDLVEPRRGLGMFVTEGARERALTLARRRFLEQEWPPVLQRIEELGLSAARLLPGAPSTQAEQEDD